MAVCLPMPMPEMNVSRRSPGGVLDAEVTAAILDAALAELADLGYGRLSMDGVARRAKAGKAALYRRWPAKQDMVLAAVTRVSLPVALSSSTGDIRTDVVNLVSGVDAWISDPLMSRVLPDLLAEARRNPELAQALTSALGAPRRNYGRTIIEAAIERGEVQPDVDIEYVLDLVAAPVFWRVCGLRQETTPGFLDRVVGTALHALGLP
ncbi:TetR family transcriptional regulator [Mycolicibacterium tokaiense]|uniref:TetR family transcriptional regulator n=2 Tax=Mycolicibacterium tokaiense TaxID=39695 RepID=A0A378TAE5_9MYCO|nr:TetR family transcriptional regulator [Mycolicibacterium tokaiense]